MTESLTQLRYLLLVADLQRRLDEIADTKIKDWFEAYLKHSVQYRGVKTPDVSKTMVAWSHAHGIRQFPDGAQLSLAKTLIRRHHAEDKFAGILYIQKYLLRKLAAGALFETTENLFKSGAFVDWSTRPIGFVCGCLVRQSRYTDKISPAELAVGVMPRICGSAGHPLCPSKRS